MSFWSEKWAYEQEVRTSGAKFVLVCVAHHADEHGYCYPSQKRLAAMTGLSERAVRGHLAALEEDGVISREERRNTDGRRTSDGFYLHIPEDELRLPAETAASKTSPAKNVDFTGKKRRLHRQLSQTSPAESAGPLLNEPSVNRQEPSEEVVVGDIPDDKTTRCLQLLLQVKDFPRDQGQNALKLAEYRREFPTVDPEEVCRDFAANISEKPFRKGDKPRLRLRNFFKQAAKSRKPSKTPPPEAPAINGKVAEDRRKEGYEWLFGETG